MTINPDTGDTAAAVVAGMTAADPAELRLGGFHIVHSASGGVATFDLTGDEYRDQPKAIRRRVQVDDVASLLTYWNKYSQVGSELYADASLRCIVGIIDAPPDVDTPDWCQHRAELHLAHSEPWRAWAAHDREYMRQDTFAEFLEDHTSEILDPPAAEMLEVVQTLRASTKVTFRSGYRTQDGQRQFSYVEETEGRSGAQGQLSIPQRFRLALPVWRGDQDAVAVDARLRYRIVDGGKLTLGYFLDRLDQVADAVFGEVVDQVAAGTGQAVMRGQP